MSGDDRDFSNYLARVRASVIKHGGTDDQVFGYMTAVHRAWRLTFTTTSDIERLAKNIAAAADQKSAL